ncbi:hypothetical protein [Streptomyces sp. NPDC059009]|uniref:hypothetical protein n=1 Tax=Streptomyces sp. NPDC059009 TaxID=3346694 RepID=UPI0036C733E0
MPLAVRPRTRVVRLRMRAGPHRAPAPPPGVRILPVPGGPRSSGSCYRPAVPPSRRPAVPPPRLPQSPTDAVTRVASALRAAALEVAAPAQPS